MKYFILSDIHFVDKSLPDLIPTFEWIVQEYEKHQPRRILFLGDFFDNRTTLKTTDIAAAKSLIRDLQSKAVWPGGCDFHFLVGNHDMPYLENPSINSVSMFESERIHIHDCLETVTLDGLEFVFAPWHEDHTVIVQYIETVPEKASKIFLGHLALEGSRMLGANDRTGRICEAGSTGVTVSLLSQFRQAFLGHFHMHASYAEGKVVYVGSPIQSDFGESGDMNKGYLIFVSESQTNGSQIEWSLQRNPHVSKYMTMAWSKLKILMEGNETLPNFAGHRIRISGLDDHCIKEPNVVIAAKQWLRDHGTIQEKFQSIPKEILPSLPTLELMHSEDANQVYTIGGLLKSFSDHTNSITASQRSYINHILGQLPSLGQHSKTERNSDFVASISTIQMTNFLDVKSQFLDLTKLKSGFVHLIIGINGSGKSTILEAIYWCLFNKLLRDSAIKVDVLRKNNDVKTCKVTIAFSNGYIISRDQSGSVVIKSPDSSQESGPQEMKYTTGKSKDAIERVIGISANNFARVCLVNTNNLLSFDGVKDDKQDAFIKEIIAVDFQDLINHLSRESKVLDTQSSENFTQLDKLTTEAKILDSNKDTLSDRIKQKKKDLLQTSENLTRLQQSQKKTEAARCIPDMEQEITDIQDRIAKERKTLEEEKTCLTFVKAKEELDKLVVETESVESQLEFQRQESFNRLDIRSELTVSTEDETIAIYHRICVELETTKRFVSTLPDSFEPGLEDPIRLADQISTVTNLLSELQNSIDIQRSKLEQDFDLPLQQLREKLRALEEQLAGCVTPSDIIETYVNSDVTYVNAFDQFNNFKLQWQERKDRYNDLAMVKSQIQTQLVNQELAKRTLHQSERDLTKAETNLFKLENAVKMSALREKIAILECLRQEWNILQEKDHMLQRSRQRIAVLRAEIGDKDVATRTEHDLEISRAQNKISLDTKRLQVLNDDLGHYQNNLQSIQKSSAVFENQQNMIETDLASMHNECVRLQNKMQALVEKKANLASKQTNISANKDLNSFWISTIKSETFRRFCTDKPLAYINKLIHSNLQWLASVSVEDPVEQNLGLHYDFSLTVDCKLQPGPTCLRYKTLSSGQKKRIALSVYLSLYQMHVMRSSYQSKFVFFDEIFDTLDDSGKIAMQAWLRAFSKHRGTETFVITHDTALQTGDNIDKIMVRRSSRDGILYRISI